MRVFTPSTMRLRSQRLLPAYPNNSAVGGRPFIKIGVSRREFDGIILTPWQQS